MNKTMNLSRFVKNEWITISMTIMSVALYLGITTRNVHGMIGFVALNTVVFSILGNCIYEILDYRMTKKQGIILTILSIMMLVVQLCKDGTIETIGVLTTLTGIILVLFLWSIFERKKYNTIRMDILLAFVGLFFAIVYIWLYAGTFSPDSYSYYEIAETIGNDFGKVGTIRQYTVRSDYNCSFPYFYPLCIFIVDTITGLGRYSGVLLNFYMMLFTGVLFFKVSKRMTSKTWCGSVAFFVLTTTISYLEELCAARAIPVAIFLSTSSFYLLAEAYYFKRDKWTLFLTIGLLNGFLMSTRFDALVMVLYCVFLLLFYGKEIIKRLTSYFTGVGIAALPWILYSLKHFGTLWASDNSGTVFLVNTTVPTRVNIPGSEVSTLFNAPNEWFLALLQKVERVLISLKDCSWIADVVIVVGILLIIFAVFRKKIAKNELIALVVFSVFYLGKTAMYILVGYRDIRYHIETVVLFAFVIMMICAKCELETKYKQVFLCVACIELVLTGYIFSGVINRTRENKEASALDRIEVQLEWVTTLDKELQTEIEDKDSDILFITDGYVFGGWTDWKVYVHPAICNIDTVKYVMENYMDVDYIVVHQKFNNLEIMDYLNNTYSGKPVYDFMLYRVGE